MESFDRKVIYRRLNLDTNTIYWLENARTEGNHITYGIRASYRNALAEAIKRLLDERDQYDEQQKACDEELTRKSVRIKELEEHSEKESGGLRERIKNSKAINEHLANINHELGEENHNLKTQRRERNAVHGQAADQIKELEAARVNLSRKVKDLEKENSEIHEREKALSKANENLWRELETVEKRKYPTVEIRPLSDEAREKLSRSYQVGKTSEGNWWAVQKPLSMDPNPGPPVSDPSVVNSIAYFEARAELYKTKAANERLLQEKKALKEQLENYEGVAKSVVPKHPKSGTGVWPTHE